VLGRTTVANPAARHELAEAVVLGVGKGTGIGAKCFEPRHGIRATYGEKVVDLVICFACHWVYVFPDGREEQTSSHPTGGRAEPLLNRLLTEANVPLPKPAGPK